MRKKTSQKVWLLILAAMLLLMASGCAGKEGNSNEAAKTGDSGNASKVSASGFPIVKEPITLKMFGKRSPQDGPFNDMLVFKEYAKMTNINVNFEDAPSQGYDEKKNLVFASNDLPDAFYKAGITPTEAQKYGSSGMLIPLEGLIDKYAPNIKKLFDQYPDVKKSLTSPDGHIYSLSDIVTLQSARTGLKPWINKDWLKKLNLKEPTTPEELINVLRAFRDKDPNGNGQKDEIPILAMSQDQLIYSMSGSWGLNKQMGYYINIDNDKVHLWVTDDRYKEYLMFLHQLYSEQLLDNEIFTQDGPKWLQKINSGKVGVFFIQSNGPFSAVQNSYQGMAPIKGPHGDQVVASVNPIARSFGAFAITSVNKYPEATMRWIDYFYGDEGSIFFRYGIEGQTWYKKPDGTPEYNDSLLNDKRGSDVAVGQMTAYPGGGSPEWINDKNSSGINPPIVADAQKRLDPYMPKTVLGPPLMNDEDTEKMNTLRTDIDTFIDESAAKFIIGDLSFDKWDEYVATLKKLKIDDLQKLYQSAYDKINKK